MIPTHLMGMLAAGALAFWVLGGVVLRVCGWLYLVTGTLGVFLGHGFEPLLFLLLGGAMWLLGHWHYALRHGAFKGPVAAYVFCRWVPAWMDPTRAWRSF